MVSYPNKRAIKSYSLWARPDQETALERTVAGSESRSLVGGHGGHPDVGPVKGHTQGDSTGRESVYNIPGTGLKLRNATSVRVRHPNVGAVEGHACRARTGSKGPE